MELNTIDTIQNQVTLRQLGIEDYEAVSSLQLLAFPEMKP